MVVGSASIWIVAYFLSWKYTALVSIIPLVILFSIMIILPETPYWLIEAEKLDLARYISNLNFYKKVIVSNDYNVLY